MKKTFTKIISSTLLLTVMAGGVMAQAQTTGVVLASVADVKHVTKADSAATITAAPAAKKADDAVWTPVRRLWGYAFGDMYYNAHADATNRGGESMYNGVPQDRNAFQFRRLYLGYDYDISPRFTAEMLLASEPNANTGVNGTTAIQNGDNLVDNKMGFFIKNFNLRYRNIWKGTDLVVGEMSTPGFALNEPGTNGPTSLSEATWGNRFIEKTITDFHKNNSYDVGAALQGTFDPSTKNYGYVFMVGDNTGASLLPASNPNTGFYKIYYATVWGKFFNKQLYVDLYADYAPTAASTATVGFQSHSIKKIFAAYLNPKVNIGVEAYTQQISNGITNKTTTAAEDATVNGLSVWVKGPIVQNKLAFFARFDSYNPDNNYSTGDSYSVNTNYGAYNPTTKETFYTAGLDFTPEAKIHFSPNVWLINYQDQRSATTTGYVPNDHNLVFRMTFYYTFGK
jgi:hypothetical protein